jgi:hypothetical protein
LEDPQAAFPNDVAEIVLAGIVVKSFSQEMNYSPKPIAGFQGLIAPNQPRGERPKKSRSRPKKQKPPDRIKPVQEVPDEL